jgi:hypothetical protein
MGFCCATCNGADVQRNPNYAVADDLETHDEMRVDADAMQKRLSARSSSVVESPRSGGGSDPKLTHVRTIQANDF